MVAAPGVAPVAVTEQLVPESAHVAEDDSLTLPVPPVWEKVTVSPEMVPVAPDTVAVQDEVAPAAREAGVHETAVVVVVALGEYWNVVFCAAEPPLPPHAASTAYSPETQLTVPPATMLPLYAPVEGLTASS
jgi:hypothetical protein